jgi:hypothetical protein
MLDPTILPFCTVYVPENFRIEPSVCCATSVILTVSPETPVTVSESCSVSE